MSEGNSTNANSERAMIPYNPQSRAMIATGEPVTHFQAKRPEKRSATTPEPDTKKVSSQSEVTRSKVNEERPNTENMQHQRYQGRSFVELRHDAIRLIHNPDRRKAEELREEMDVIYLAAREAGVYHEIQIKVEGIRNSIGNPQNHRNIDFKTAIHNLEAIDVNGIENDVASTASKKGDWNEKFKGMIKDYRDLTVLELDAILDAAEVRQIDEQIISTRDQREKKTLQEVRNTLEVKAKKAYEQVKLRSIEPIHRELYPKAEAELKRHKITQAEKGKPIKVEQSVDQFRVQAEIERRNFFEKELNGQIFTPTNLFVYGLDTNTADDLTLRVGLSNARAAKQIGQDSEGMSKMGEFIAEAGKEDLKKLTNEMKGAPVIAIYSAFTKDQATFDTYSRILGITTRNPFRGEVAASEWKQFRSEMAIALVRNFGMQPQEAALAERVGYNFFMTLGYIEDIDRSFKIKPLEEVLNTFLRDLKYPSEKIRKAAEEYPNNRKPWPTNELGEWYLRQIENPSFLTRLRIRLGMISVNPADRLPFPNEPIFKSPIDDPLTKSLLGNLPDKGLEILSTGNVNFSIDWDRGSEKPFKGYWNLRVTQAALVYAVLSTGAFPSGKDFPNLGAAYENLDIRGKKWHQFKRTLVYLVLFKGKNLTNHTWFGPSVGAMEREVRIDNLRISSPNVLE